MAFDPDKYLAASAGSAGASPFDPDAYLAQGNKSEPSTMDTVGRKLGLGARAVVQGATQLPGMVYDAAAVPVNLGISAYNALTGSDRPQISSAQSMVSGAMDSAGLPKPETRGERIVSAVNEGAASMIPGVGAGALLANASSPIVRGVAQTMAAQPTGQIVAGAGGGAGSQTAAEMGFGPVGQAVGGVTGALAVPAAMAGVARMAAPNVRPEIQEFMARGGTPNWRQLADRADDPAARLPIVGPMVQESERRSVRDFGRIAGNEAAEQMGARLSPQATGNAIPAELKQVIDKTYSAVAPKFTAQLDDAFMADVSGVRRIAQRLPDDVRGQLEKTITQELADVPLGQKVDGAKLLELKRTFRDLAYDTRAESPKLAEAYKQIEDGISSFLRRANPEAFKELAGADAAYARYLPIRNAASKALGAGDFTPAQLARGAAKYGGEDAAARGVAPMQSTAQMGIGVMGDRPFNQNVQRMGLMDMLQHPLATAGGFARLPLYTPWGQRAAAVAMTQRPEYVRALADALRYPTAGAVGIASVPR